MPQFEKPSVADLRHAAEQLGMNPSMHYLNTVQDIVAPLVAAYAALDAMPDEKPAVKYPRDGGRRPSAGRKPARRLVRQDRDQGRGRAASSPAAASR